MGLADRVSLSPDRPSQSTAVTVLTFLSVALSMGVSPPLLTVLGIPYDAPTGSFIFKLHPGTYVLAAAFALALAERGNPLAELGRSLAHQPAVAFYLLADALVTAFSVARHGFSGAAFFVDSQLAPGVLALLLARLDLATLRRLFGLIVAFLAINSALGVAEQLLQARLIPLTVAGGQDLGRGGVPRHGAHRAPAGRRHDHRRGAVRLLERGRRPSPGRPVLARDRSIALVRRQDIPGAQRGAVRAAPHRHGAGRAAAGQALVPRGHRGVRSWRSSPAPCSWP
jgi:hypothetical protein